MSAVRSQRFRALIAERVTESWQTIPHFTATREILADPLLQSYRALRENVPELTLTDLMLSSLARGARTIDDGEFDIGLAVASEFGVMMPVLKRASHLSLRDIVASRVAAVTRGRIGRLSADDIAAQPRTSLSNLGALGVDQFSGIVPKYQQSILTVGRVRERGVVEGGQLVPRSTFFATLNVDHRVLDGAEAARMLLAFDGACAAEFTLEN